MLSKSLVWIKRSKTGAGTVLAGIVSWAMLTAMHATAWYWSFLAVNLKKSAGIFLKPGIGPAGADKSHKILGLWPWA
jgi:hypothetical protein